jgi:hypothetical protein
MKNKTKKLNRPSPHYPVNDYCGKKKNKNGICRWVKLK